MNDEDLGRLEACPPSDPPSGPPGGHYACRLAVSQINRISSVCKGNGTFS